MNSDSQTANLVTAQSGVGSGCARARDQVVAAICERIAEGEVIEDICGADRDDDFPNWRTFYKWLLKDPEIKKSYDEAVQARLLKFVDSTFKIANDGSNDWMEKHNEKGEMIGWQLNGEAVQRSKIRISNIQWYAEKIGRAVFGPSVALGGSKDLPPIQNNVTVAPAGTPEEVYRALLTGGVLAKPVEPEQAADDPESWV